MKKVSSLVVVSLILSLSSYAAEYVDNQVLLRFKGATTLEQARAQVDNELFEVTEALVPSLNLFLVKTKNTANRKVSAVNLLALFNRMETVEYASLDHKVTPREVPNDPKFETQWSLKNGTTGADIQAQEAWNLGTGGKDALGNDIVVAIVDSGVDIAHPDIAPNLWVNEKEIPDNNKDDDGNGYVDDVNGWNAYNNTGKMISSSHGTHVAGIVGAKGNNKIHTTGINWDVKIMPIAGSTSTTSIVARAYGYVIKQKELYLESKGKKGANIVVTNSSFGIDRGDCTQKDYKTWNDLYESMGNLGILSAAAAPNQNWDVDVVGDIPTGCSSPYIVTVTNTTSDDGKYMSAGFGKTQIDIGAPGTQIISTTPGEQTGPMTGTSMATPHIAGAIAFLHSVAHKDLAQKFKDAPAEAALALKDILLNTVEPIKDLEGKSVSGGRLNLFKAATTANSF